MAESKSRTSPPITAQAAADVRASSSKRRSGKKAKARKNANDSQPVCGIVMPISAIDDCTEAHWSEVRAILEEAIEMAGFEPHLVSDADDVGIIQKRIIQNVYENPMVVCDVSGKNPNVMFELGLRLAFDKPTVIVKDDKTTYSFDTAPIEHLEYPRDLRFARIVEFKESLSEKVQATHKKATDDPNYTTFLKHFGSFTVAKLDTKTVSTEAFILEELRGLRELVSKGLMAPAVEVPLPPLRRTLCIHDFKGNVDDLRRALAELVPGRLVIKTLDDEHVHARFPEARAIPTDIVMARAKNFGTSRFMK